MSSSDPVTPDRWRQVNDLFHRALAEPAERRHAFLAGASHGDATLGAEVESLLIAHDQAGDFIEHPATAGPPNAGPAAGTFTPGQMVGQYRIERVLGRGGMGVVYLADDLRLGRKVALKAVAPGLVGDTASRERLRREARAAAALAHPGIATVYALEELDGQMLIAGEFVPGDTLREELNRGPLGASRARETALLIARALAAAHDQGIVHRDLKPENIMRLPNGELKILDFGLARMRDAPSDAARPSAGRFLGTPAYMSPEQIRGDAVDGRSDLFSFGTMLFEFLTGVHPFMGADNASTLARVLEAEPVAGPDTTGGLGEIARTCLQKDRNARYPSAHAVIRTLEDGPASAPRAVADSRWWWQFHQGAASAAYLALLLPLWLGRGWIGGAAGLVLFLSGLSGGLAAVILRLHLWFTVRAYPAEWAIQRDEAGRWLRVADLVFVLSLAGSGLWIAGTRLEAGVMLIAAAVAALIAFAIIEPATTRAAFGAPAPSTPAPRSR